jgi:riboflavin synthase
MATSTLGAWRPGRRVNLERPLAAGGRFGGHIVQGHVDGRGELRAIRREAESVTFEFAAPDDLRPLIVPKGSIAVDGVSLTVAEREAAGFTVSLIPHTLAQTTLGDRRVGDAVNLEADILAKYVAAAIANQRGAAADGGGGLTWEWLAEHGYG